MEDKVPGRRGKGLPAQMATKALKTSWMRQCLRLGELQEIEKIFSCDHDEPCSAKDLAELAKFADMYGKQVTEGAAQGQ